IEAGQLTLKPSRFLLRPLLDGLIEMLRPQAASRELRLELSVTDSVPLEMTADPGRLRQVLMNLLSNALKYADPGDVVLHVELQSGDGLGWLRLSVIDPGPAIPPAQHVHLFEPFAQLESTRTTGAGCGLGLAICRHLVASMGGDIGCSNAQRGGNEFWVTLPLLADRGSSERTQSGRVVPRTRLLLVEDVAANRLSTVLLLRGEGHRVTGVADATAALRELARAPYDLVLLDMHLPGVGGLELATLIRAMSGPNRQVILIGLTGDGRAETRMAGLAAGMTAVLQKGLCVAEWRDVILRHVWRARERAAFPARFPTDDCPVMDETRLAELRATIGQDSFAGLTECCVRDLFALLEDARCAEAVGDDAAMRSAMHAMAGLAANYGLMALLQRLQQTPDVQAIAAEVARASDTLGCAARSEMV
ncbi:MAG TPA: ATP-binding protein, partial [Acetobacteraceae bacterium]|nr:ATP-binding protein [Acetobacteraceae bacterium]